MKATCIKWDTDGDRELRTSIPKDIELPNELTDGEVDYDGIDNYLSNEIGFCHFGYILED